MALYEVNQLRGPSKGAPTSTPGGGAAGRPGGVGASQRGGSKGSKDERQVVGTCCAAPFSERE
ncbi:hypothetical protein [Hymenobacter bucti]|uniref:Uncharacterized protein n=1 Tax=Hymenobacter bucti TaxID=1844114 RepID=A0ABW4QNK9_9BACT